MDRVSVAKRLTWDGVRRGRSELLLACLVIRAGGPRLSLPSGPSPGRGLGLGCGPLRACAPQRGGRPLLLLMGSYPAAPGSPHPRFRANSLEGQSLAKCPSLGRPQPMLADSMACKFARLKG